MGPLRYLLPLLAACRLDASDYSVFYAQNAGLVDNADVKYRLYGVSQVSYLRGDSIQMRSRFGEMTLRFATREPANYVSLERWPGILNRFAGASSSNWRRAEFPRTGAFNTPRLHRTSMQNSDREATTGCPRSPSLCVRAETWRICFSRPAASERSSTIAPARGPCKGYRSGSCKNRGHGREVRGGIFSLDAVYRGASANRVAFAVAAYDRTLPLFIEVRLPFDPIPRPATPAGTQDSAGNNYAPAGLSSDLICSVAGTGGGPDFCPDTGVLATRQDGQPIFLTILAGTHDEYVYAPVIGPGSDGNLVAVGRTGSADFPVTADAMQRTNAGPIGSFSPFFPLDGDLFISVLDGKSGDLRYSTFLGGSEPEFPQRQVVGPNGLLAMLIFTGASFPATSGAWLTTVPNTDRGGLVAAVFDPVRRQLRFATFLPPRFEVASIKFGSDGSLYLSGASPGGSVATQGSLQPDFGGGVRDGYLIRLAPDGSRPLYSHLPRWPRP